MRSCLALTLVLASLASQVLAAPPPPPPAPVMMFQGKDQVLIGRIYLRQGGATQPLARFGTVLSGKTASRTVSVSSPETGNVTVTFDARRDGETRSQVSWSLQAGGGARIAPAQGKLTVGEGSIGHAALGMAGEAELFASLETGRASGFNLQRLYDHFGVVTDAARFPQPAPAQAWQAPAAAPAAMTAPAPASASPRGGSMTLSCPSGQSYDLATGSGLGRCRVSVDGDKITGGTCDDDDGNSASASCTLNGGKGACVSATGSGSCRLQ